MARPRPSAETTRARLLRAATDCFLDADYHRVTTRTIAAKARANVSMIRYHFGSKQGLYEEMIRELASPILAALEGPLLSSPDGFARLLALYYDFLGRHPALPQLVFKVLALRQGPGRHFLEQLLGFGRVRAAGRVQAMRARGELSEAADPDLVRIAFLSLAVMPMLLKETFEREMGRPMDARFLGELADFNGGLLLAGLAPRPRAPRRRELRS